MNRSSSRSEWARALATARVSDPSTDDSPGMIAGLILPIGRVAADSRKRSLLPARLRFPDGGVRLLLEHQGREVMVFEPVAVDWTATTSRPCFRIAMKAANSPEGVEAAALVPSGAYEQARAELRGRELRWWF